VSPTVTTPSGPLPREQRLTSREREVLLLIAEGCTSREIASRLQISRKTVEAFRGILLGKSRAKNSVQLVLKAQALGWLDLFSTPDTEV
jgi:two-component system, NarL family, response regulator LiaR